MDELKELYGIEMATHEKKILALMILCEEMKRTVGILEMASNSSQRIDALKRQKAIEYVASFIGETE